MVTTLHDLADSWPNDNGDPPDTDYQRGYMVACQDCAAELRAALAETGWRPLAEAPDTLADDVPLYVWGKEARGGNVHPYPGGGWWMTIYGSRFYGRLTVEYLLDQGFTHFRADLFPPPPPGELP